MPPVWKSIFKFRILIPWHIYSVLKQQQQHQKRFLEQQILILIFRSITTYWQWLMWGIFFSRENVAEKFRFGSQSNDDPPSLPLLDDVGESRNMSLCFDERLNLTLLNFFWSPFIKTCFHKLSTFRLFDFFINFYKIFLFITVPIISYYHMIKNLFEYSIPGYFDSFVPNPKRSCKNS